MDFTFIIILILVGYFLVDILLKMFQRRKELTVRGTFKYKIQKNFFTQAERAFLEVLEQAMGNDYKIFGKVRVAEIFTPDVPKKFWWSAFNKINSKHFDYVLCSQDRLDVQCIIELHDGSHNRSDRTERDNFLRKICEDSKIPFLEFTVLPSYNIQSVRKTIEKELENSTSAVIER